ncbi:MAG: hypothetical protein ACI9C1_003165 [Candidatus Aldehydirespiratoraceae bacterium]|jgi:hypothetical protein
MSMAGGGNGFDGIDKVAGRDIDLKKLVRKPAAIPKAETPISGATSDAISAFLASSETPAVSVPAQGLGARLRKLWRRSSD